MIAPEPGPHPEASLLHYWLILKRRLGMVAAMTLGTMVVVGVITRLMTPYYGATSTIEIDPRAPSMLDVEEVYDLVNVRFSDERRSYYTTQYRIIKSRRVIEECLRRLRDEHGITEFDEAEDPVADFLDMMELQPEGDTELVHLSITHPDPTRAVLYSQTLAETYMDINVERARDRSQDALEELKRQQESYEQDIHAVAQEQDQLDLVQTAERFKTAQETLRQVQTELADVRTRIPGVETDYNNLRARVPSEEAVNSGTDGDEWLGLISHLADENQGLGTTYSRLQDLRHEEIASEGRYKEEHPKVKRLNEKVVGTRLLMRRQLVEYMEGRRAKLELLRARERALAEQAESLITELDNLKGDQIRYDRLQATQLRREELYREMGQRLAEVSISNALRKSNVTWVDYPIATTDPVRPKLIPNLALAMMVGLVSSVALVFFLEYIKPADLRVKTSEDIEQFVGIPLLGPVPSLPEADFRSLPHQLLVHARPRSQLAEYLRTIRTTILFRTADKRLRRLLVTSAMEQEGKSFISSNLAAIMCMAGSRVLLIDADLRRPRQHAIFGQTNESGLSSVLAGAMTLEQAIRPSPVPGLDLLPAGPPPQNPAELLESELMQRLLDSITGYDLVLIDSPPVSPVADPLILSRYVDGVIMVVRFHRAAKKQVLRCRQRLSEVDAPLLGAIGNRFDEQPEEYYGYGYGYGYGSGYGYGYGQYGSNYHDEGEVEPLDRRRRKSGGGAA